MRRLISVLGVSLALLLGVLPAQAAAPTSGATTALNPNGRLLGVVPVQDARSGARPRKTSNLSYHNGPTMNANTTYAIFWGGSQPWDGGYQDLIKQYFGDVQAAGATQSNVYYSSTQYYDTTTGATRYIQDTSTFGGAYVDPNSYPANGCTDKATSICLSDAQLQAEIQADTSHLAGWTGGESQLVFIFTPKGVGSCYGSSCSYTNFCAYHSWIGSGNSAILYANQPYANQNYSIYTCNSGQWPNGNSADATLNVVSHEHNEAITDQQGSAWYDSSGNENGDKCAWHFGSTTTSTPNGKYNQLINIHPYYLQQEWSNASSGCVLTGL
jgi:hypothetical protein